MSWYDRDVEFASMVGKTFDKIWTNEDEHELHFLTDTGHHYMMYHLQDCCESVSLEDIAGDLEDLLATPILQAETVSSRFDDEDDLTLLPQEFINARLVEKLSGKERYSDDSETWTFYKLATIKGSVTLRWYGTSNGYYSERVDFVEVTSGT